MRGALNSNHVSCIVVILKKKYEEIPIKFLPLDADCGEVERWCDGERVLEVVDELAHEVAKGPGVREQFNQLQKKKRKRIQERLEY